MGVPQFERFYTVPLSFEFNPRPGQLVRTNFLKHKLYCCLFHKCDLNLDLNYMKSHLFHLLNPSLVWFQIVTVLI